MPQPGLLELFERREDAGELMEKAKEAKAHVNSLLERWF
jgi:hypothetical protein